MMALFRQCFSSMTFKKVSVCPHFNLIRSSYFQVALAGCLSCMGENGAKVLYGIFTTLRGQHKKHVLFYSWVKLLHCIAIYLHPEVTRNNNFPLKLKAQLSSLTGDDQIWYCPMDPRWWAVVKQHSECNVTSLLSLRQNEAELALSLPDNQAEKLVKGQPSMEKKWEGGRKRLCRYSVCKEGFSHMAHFRAHKRCHTCPRFSLVWLTCQEQIQDFKWP